MPPIAAVFAFTFIFGMCAYRAFLKTHEEIKALDRAERAKIMAGRIRVTGVAYNGTASSRAMRLVTLDCDCEEGELISVDDFPQNYRVVDLSDALVCPAQEATQSDQVSESPSYESPVEGNTSFDASTDACSSDSTSDFSGDC